MALSLTESSTGNPPKFNPLIGKSYQLALNRSMEELLAEIRKENPNFSSFTQSFYELMQVHVDPPIECIWVYSGLKFGSRSFTNDDPMARISVIKDLFQFVSACSAPSGSSKSIGLLAPIVFEVYKLMVAFVGKDLGLKKERKVMKEVKSFVDVLVGYISLSCCKDLSEENDSECLNFVTPFADLVCVWMGGNEIFESFLPLVSVDICREIGVGECGVGYFAGVVIVEVFLLKLCLEIRAGSRGEELERELRSWAVGAITGFQNCYFYEILLRMMGDSNLAVASLLDSEKVLLLRRVLYDALILVEYSFLHPEKSIHLPAERMKSIAMTRLIVMHEGIEFFREAGDQQTAISYINAFSSSRLPSEIINWVTSQIGMEEDAHKSYSSSPKVLLQWLLKLEDQGGVRVFDDSSMKYRAKLVLDISKVKFEESASKVNEGGKLDASSYIYVDNKGEDGGDREDNMVDESMSASFVAAARTMKSTAKEERKRKQGKGMKNKKQIKFLKYEVDVSDSARKSPLFVGEDDSNSDSEVDDPVSD